jgi:hypothetical protein
MTGAHRRRAPRKGVRRQRKVQGLARVVITEWMRCMNVHRYGSRRVADDDTRGVGAQRLLPLVLLRFAILERCEAPSADQFGGRIFQRWPQSDTTPCRGLTAPLTAELSRRGSPDVPATPTSPTQTPLSVGRATPVTAASAPPASRVQPSPVAAPDTRRGRCRRRSFPGKTIKAVLLCDELARVVVTLAFPTWAHPLEHL